MYSFKYMKERLSQLYLDIASRLPKASENWIANLQELKERQDIQAEEYLAKSRRPEGNDIALNSICIYELYLLEDFGNLERSLLNIYAQHNKRSFPIGNDVKWCRQFIKQASGSFSSGGWQNLGWISSKDKERKSLSSFMMAYLRGFPKEIERMEINLHHILPSVIIVSFNITFEKTVNEEIESMINTKWRGKVILASLLPGRYGYSVTSSKEAKERALYNYLKNLRVKAENFIRKYFSGHFLSDKKKSVRPVCPCIEIFSISEISYGEDDLDERIKSNREFWHSLGFEWHLKYNIFKSDGLFFFSASNDSDNSNHPYRLLIIKKGLNKEIYSSTQGGIYLLTLDFLRGYTNSIGLFELCNKTMRHVGELRLTIGKSLFLNRFFPGRFRTLLRLSESIDREIFVLNRLVSEYEDIRKNRIVLWKCNQLDAVQLSKLQKKLSECFLDSIDRQIDLIKKQYETTNETFKNYLSGLNSKVTYKLQRKVFLLTLILVAGVLVQIFLALPKEIQSKIWIKIVSIVLKAVSIFK